MQNLTPDERQTLQRWLRTNVSLHDIQQFDHVGLVGNVRFTNRCKRIYALLWTWSAPRFFSSAGEWQDACHRKNGQEFINKRMARCSAIIEALKA